MQQADFDKQLGNLSGGAKQAYDNVLERGYTPQQALAYAQDYQGIESPISRMDAGTPRMSALTADRKLPRQADKLEVEILASC